MLRLIGLLVLLMLAVAGGWYLRDRALRDNAPVTAEASWKPTTGEGAAQAKQQVASLARSSKPFVVIAPEDLAAYIFMLANNKLPPASYNVRATAVGDRVMLRATVNPKELGAGKILGALAGLLSDREELRLTGTFHLVRAGLAELRIEEARVRDITVPPPLLPAIIKQFSTLPRPEGVSDNALPVPLPEHVQDIRVSEGRMLVYRRNP